MDSTLLLIMFAIANTAFVVQTIRLRIANCYLLARRDRVSVLDKRIESLRSDIKSELEFSELVVRAGLKLVSENRRLASEKASCLESVKYWKSQVGKAG